MNARKKYNNHKNNYRFLSGKLKIKKYIFMFNLVISFQFREKFIGEF